MAFRLAGEDRVEQRHSVAGVGAGLALLARLHARLPANAAANQSDKETKSERESLCVCLVGKGGGERAASGLPRFAFAPHGRNGRNGPDADWCFLNWGVLALTGVF